jgi:hypothetical protein
MDCRRGSEDDLHHAGQHMGKRLLHFYPSQLLRHPANAGVNVAAGSVLFALTNPRMLPDDGQGTRADKSCNNPEVATDLSWYRRSTGECRLT